MELGYALSSEEHGPDALVRNARRAEDAGFTFALVSDHYHPWTTRQGESGFVWSVLGAIAVETRRLRVGTGVTCPTFRIHPAILAQAAATVAVMMPGRFFLGVGTGEYLNEHVIGIRWPLPSIRLEMLEEAIAILRLLWQGGFQSHRGRHFEVDRARVFTIPDSPPPILVAASGEEAAALAGRVGDGFVGTKPDRELLEVFRGAGGAGKRTFGHLKVCWAASEREAKATTREWWPNAALGGELKTDLATPAQFESALELAREEDVVEHIVCGPDADRHVRAIRAYEEAGYDAVYVHQIGPDQEGFLRFYEREVMGRVART